MQFSLSFRAFSVSSEPKVASGRFFSKGYPNLVHKIKVGYPFYTENDLYSF